MTRSEAGKLGYLKSKEARDAIKSADNAKKEADYLANPKICGGCKKLIPFNKRRQKFCSRSCSAIYTNTRLHGTFNPEKCAFCNKLMYSHQKTFCSNICHQAYRQQEYIKRWLENKEDGIVAGGLSTSKTIYRYIREKQNGYCSICGGNEWQGKPMPLILDHIDGNGMNNRPENLRMVCGNCDMQLPTYKNANKGKGRAARKKYSDSTSNIFKKKIS